MLLLFPDERRPKFMPRLRNVPVARREGGGAARLGQLRKPEQQVGAEVKHSVETPRKSREVRIDGVHVPVLSYEKLVVNRGESSGGASTPWAPI